MFSLIIEQLEIIAYILNAIYIVNKMLKKFVDFCNIYCYQDVKKICRFLSDLILLRVL